MSKLLVVNLAGIATNHPKRWGIGKDAPKLCVAKNAEAYGA
jgi:hypothetical protein